MLTRKSFQLQVISTIKKYRLINESFSDAIMNLFKSKLSDYELMQLPLLRYAFMDNGTLDNLEKYLEKRSFTNIEVPILRLKSNFREYHAVIAELDAAEVLFEEGKKNITFLPQTKPGPDISFLENGEVKYVEVKCFKSINPELDFLHDKLQATSIFEPVFRKWFVVGSDFELSKFDSVDILHNKLAQAVEDLRAKLKTLLIKGEINNEIFNISGFLFKVKTSKSHDNIFHLAHTGGVSHYRDDSNFLIMSSVYQRFLRDLKKGYLQLLDNRMGDINLVRGDLILFFLRTGIYSRVEGDVTTLRLNNLLSAVGMRDNVGVKIVP